LKVAVVLVVSSVTTAKEDDVCRALVMSGGGANGSWEVGVLWGFLHYGNPEDFAYDEMSGVSAGAINTAALSVWAKGDEKRATEWLSETWAQLENRDIWEPWPIGVIPSILEEPSLLNCDPAITFMTDIF